MVRVVQCCSTALLQSPPLQTVGGEDARDLRGGHLQAPPLTGRTVARGVSPLQEGGAQSGQVRSPPLCPGTGSGPGDAGACEGEAGRERPRGQSLDTGPAQGVSSRLCWSGSRLRSCKHLFRKYCQHHHS